MQLRTFLTLGAVLLVVLGLGAAGGLIWTTTLLQRQTTSLSESIERVNATAELETSLFFLQVVHESEEARVTNVGPPASQDELRGRVQAALANVERYTETAEERAQVATVRARVEAYLSASSKERLERMRAAVDANRGVVASSIARARAARDEASRVSAAARLAGGLLAFVVITGVVLFLITARLRLYRPLLSIRHALEAFKSGHREWRVDQAGPRELREIAAEFNAMAETLASQDARQLQFLAGVAHDLRNPLNALKLSAQILLRAPTLPPPEKVRELLSRISTQVDRLGRMVGDLLDQTRIESGNLELQLQDCDLRGLVTEVVELHRPLSEQHRLEATVPEAPVQVRCDPTRLSQVLTNLLNNAIKYSPQGGRVQVRVEQLPESVVLAVSDEGVGIPSEEYGRIFEPFKRSKATGSDIPGVGLGLSVSRRIARAHGGDIEVESRVGAGSTFRVRLPSPPRAST
jgi:signal transduction histidine kinase